LHARYGEITDSPDRAEKVTFYRAGDQWSMNQGMIATGNHTDLDPLRGAPPLRVHSKSDTGRVRAKAMTHAPRAAGPFRNLRGRSVGACIARPPRGDYGFAGQGGKGDVLPRGRPMVAPTGAEQKRYRAWCAAQRIQNIMIAGGNHTII